jgi:sulfide:quinone oxidoreductase
MKPNVIVVGGSFAGLTAAFEIKRLLKDKVDVTVIARQDQFVFIPSFIWIVAGWRRPEQLTFDLKPALESKDIRFVNAALLEIKPEQNTIVTTNAGDFKYDYLVIATGSLTLIGMRCLVWVLTKKDTLNQYVLFLMQLKQKKHGKN